jgi:YegS/Rv2252/BmrU family lipid kinase
VPEQKYVAVILATEESGELTIFEGRQFLSHVPVSGRPMLEWVIRALKGSKKISSIVVFGPDQINELYCRRMVNIHKNSYTIKIEEITDLLFAESGQDLHTKDFSPQSNFIFLSTASILISTREIDTLITEFQQINSSVAVIASPADKFIQENYIPPFTFIKDEQVLVPAGIVISKDVLTFRNSIERLNTVINWKLRRHKVNENKSIPPISWCDINSPEKCQVLISQHFETAVLVTTYYECNQAKKQLQDQRPRAKRKNIVLIINPYSGSTTTMSKYMRNILGLKQRSLGQEKTPDELSRQIKEYLHEFGFNPEIHLTKSSEDATRIAKSCVQKKREIVVAAGGDGTINAVVNGLGKSNIICGIIPLGTVNLLATELDIPLDIRSACQLITEGNVRAIDLGQVNERYFASIAGVGFDAYIMKETHPHMKRLFGAVAYIFSGLRNVSAYPFKSIKIRIDNENSERKGYLLIVGNGKYFGAHMTVAPQAVLDDHKLDLILYKRKDITGLLQYFWGIKSGQITRNLYTDYLHIKQVSISAHGKHLVHVDGELYGATPVTIKVVPSALKIIC